MQTRNREAAASKYNSVRARSLQIAQPLSAEDCAVQSMPDASPTRWHLAHTTWFFETFLLRESAGYQPYDPSYEYLFNSYFNQVGNQFPRERRGLITRPGLSETLHYREHVDRAVENLLNNDQLSSDQLNILTIGLNHEQQHQELMFTDIKHALACNPTWPIYDDRPFESVSTNELDWTAIDEGLYSIGHDGSGFGFDNESPNHRVFLNKSRVAGTLVSCREYLQFMDDGGYSRPEFWLSLGWNKVQESQWEAPLYWLRQENRWYQFTLAGLVLVNPDWPVCHVSLYEADAFARWSGTRLPTEFEWEVAQRQREKSGENARSEDQFADHLLDNNLAIHPTQTSLPLLGGVWQWTSSSYTAYPGYVPPDGAIGEYNGKFMCNQYVLRGGSVATAQGHVRTTYRNFFPADTRWQFAGIRLADNE